MVNGTGNVDGRGSGGAPREDIGPEPSLSREELLAAGPRGRRARLLRFLSDAHVHSTGRADDAAPRRPVHEGGFEPDPGTPMHLDSLETLQLKVTVESSGLDVSLPMPRLAEAGTLGELADLVEEALDEAAPHGSAGLPRIGHDAAARYLPFALTDVQHAYWLGRSGFFAGGDVSAHLYLEFESADFDLLRARRVLGRLVRRHDMLRAVIRPDGRQQVLAEVPAPEIGWEDLSGLTRREAADRVDAMRANLSHEVRPADRWPLFALCAQHLGPGLTRVHLSIDLLVADAASIRVLLREWAVLYAEEAAVTEHADDTGEPQTDEPGVGEVSFRDYVTAVTGHEDGEAYSTARAYWTRRAA
jgi:hypothetical protein